MSQNYILRKTAGGWTATSTVPGDAWAVFAETEEDVMQKFYAAVEKHKEIDARPFNCEARGVGPFDEEKTA